MSELIRECRLCFTVAENQKGKAHAVNDFLKKLEATGTPVKTMVEPDIKELSIFEAMQTHSIKAVAVFTIKNT